MRVFPTLVWIKKRSRDFNCSLIYIYLFRYLKALKHPTVAPPQLEALLAVAFADLCMRSGDRKHPLFRICFANNRAIQA